uniref:Solute carrier family 25 member 17 n=1 Tax=Coturnix japonica TaxID=93934 RepID=A0A8C2TDC6_COTJA
QTKWLRLRKQQTWSALPSVECSWGVVNVLLTTPLWVVNTRLKLQGAKFRNEDIVPTNYKGIIDAFHQIIRDEGALALWNGTFPSLLLVFNPAIHFIFYEGFKRKLLKKQTQLTSLDAFVMGAVAKAVATTLTYPLSLLSGNGLFPKLWQHFLQTAFQTSPRNGDG